MKKVVALVFVSAALGACAPANISSSLREPSGPEMSMSTRCVDFATGGEEMNTALKQYDGWKVVYASEYTTNNKVTTSMVMCFEKPLR